MEPFDSIEKLITEHGSAAILREKIGLLKEQMAAKDAKMQELDDLLKQTKKKLDDCQSKLDRFTGEQPADICPYCRRPTGQLINHLLPSNLTRDWAGKEAYIYKCSNPDCGKNYGKQVKPVA
jgi:uncharacterized coiled-coil protein SlyX